MNGGLKRFALIILAPFLAGCSTGVTQNASQSDRSVSGPSVVIGDQSPHADSQVPDQAPTASPAPEMAIPSPSPPENSFTPSAPRITYTDTKVPGKYVAMTFDDGPHKANTPRLLDMLKERGIKATFYVVGTNVEMYPDIMRRIVAEGHEVGNHSWSHPFFTKMSDSAVRRQLQRTEDAIVQTTGNKPTNMRPPYGAISSRQKEWIHNEFGYPTIMWTVDPLDWKRPGASVVAQRIISKARPGAIILAHDIHKSTIDAMPATLDSLKSQGYQFVTVAELIDLEQGKRIPVPENSKLTHFEKIQ